MRFFKNSGAVLLPFLALASTAKAIELNPDDEASIKAAARQYAYGLMELYTNNATSTAPQDIGIWPQPHYWWEGGAAWGGMIEYSMFSGDDSHVKTLQQALTSNYGPANDFILEHRRGQTGNDDQAFWALAVMSALEYQFPDASQAPADYLDVAINSFNNIVGRWDETSCGGGLKWQIYPENSYGYNYKNSISNGCAFALGARLARYTGNQTYADWAVKIYDWTKKVGLITDIYEVFDGSDDKKDCATVADKTQWTYNNAMFLHGSAFMFDYTGGDSTWKDRTSGFLKHAELLFFRPFENSTDIMYEWACETGESGRHCNLDQQSFKAYLSRFMAKTAVMAPFTKDTITKYLKASAIGAAKACSGGASGTTCGSKWYTGSWDGTSGVGQQLSALEITQALLQLKQNIVPVKKGESTPEPTTTVTPKPSSTPKPTPTPVPSSQAPPAPSSAAPATSAVASSPAPPKSQTPPSTPSASIAPVQPAPSTSIAPSSTVQPGGQFGEKPNSNSSTCTKSGSPCTCTPSVTKTVYAPVLSTGAPVPILSTSIIPVVPANSSIPQASPSQPLQFEGAAGQMSVAVGSLIGALVVAAIAALL
ncbi:glycosyl hydrolase family 76-domain-containing protein [Paraphoma chrysanthemicola]|uniref:mannan endo-1,6-alpha-mannosidase n=1 Tax=Paraphoma chrysanthemicola TaxID=798071 RepID=A0A8K0RFG9_9PLEO|nr:glycosyl hydrolase family 76-domain-containing protein [Paraphoma chrysanthemicola]